MSEVAVELLPRSRVLARLNVCRFDSAMAQNASFNCFAEANERLNSTCIVLLFRAEAARPAEGAWGDGQICPIARQFAACSKTRRHVLRAEAVGGSCAGRFDMGATEFAVHGGHGTTNDCERLVPPWIPRLPWRTRGCERRVRFVEQKLAATGEKGIYAFRHGYILWSSMLAHASVRPFVARGRASALASKRHARCVQQSDAMDVAPEHDAAPVRVVDTSFVAQHTPDAVLGIDPCGHVRHFNDAAVSMLRCRPAELSGADVRSLFAEQASSPIAAALAEAERAGEAQLDTHLRDGTSVWIALCHRPRSEGYTLLFRPQRVERAEAILAAVGHELRSPLGVTLCWLDLLRSEEHGFDTTVLRGFHAIERSVLLQKRLIEDMLDVARLSCGGMEIALVPLDLSGQCEVIASSYKLRARAAGITLKAELQSGIVVLADDTRVHQLVQNLLDNALKFTPSGGSVRFRLWESAGFAELVVADDGRGIDAGLLPRIFAPYEQGERGVGRSTGLGLGLAIAKRISDLHHGQLSAASEGLGQGATFTWRLRLLRQAP